MQRDIPGYRETLIDTKEPSSRRRKLKEDLERYIALNYVPPEMPVRAMPSCSAVPVLKESCRPEKLAGPEKFEEACLDFSFNKSAFCDEEEYTFTQEHESKLAQRLKHRTDTFSEYLMYLIQDRGMENTDVWKRALIDRKIFSKIKNNVNYHPQKLTALCLCIGAKLNLDEAKDLLGRAGYALSPCDMTDIIFSYFIENEIYDMIELDIQLEEHGLPCIIPS